MKFLDALPTIVILALVAFLSWIGYEVYSDYKANASDPNAAGPGGALGAQKPSSFGSFVLDSGASIGQSSQSFSNALDETVTDPVGTFKSIFGIGSDTGQ